MFFGGEGQGENLARRFEGMDVARLLPVFAPPMALERLADAVCLFHAAQFDELFRTLMLRACAQTPTVDSLRQILCDLVYTIMQRNPAFVPAISHAELTEDDILRRIRAAQDTGQPAGEVTRIMHRHMTDVGGKAAALDATHIERAKSFIARNHARNLSLADLAEHLALHSNYLSALFAKVSGMCASRKPAG